MSKFGIKYVSESNGRIVYRPRLTGELKDTGHPTDNRGFLKPPIKLGLPGDSQDDIMQAYLAAKKSLLTDKVHSKNALGYISSEYMKSENFLRLSPKTQHDYRLFAKGILGHELKINSKPATLADLNISELSKPLINSIRESRLKDYQERGKKGTVAINRQISYLQTACKWGLNYIPELPNIANPFDGIDKYKEESNKRYVTTEEMEIQCREAAKLYDYLPVLIRLSYLLGTRGIETISIRHADLLEEGVYVSRRKGSKDNIIAWSKSLRQAVSDARSLKRPDMIPQENPPLITNTQCNAISQSGLQSAMQRLKKHMHAEGLGDVFFTLHKTKSKAQSDSQDDDISGLSARMKDRYMTKKKVIDTGLE